MPSSCLTCFRKSLECFCPAPANDDMPWDAKKIRIAPHDRIARPSAIRRSAIVYRAMDIPRRDIPGFAEDRIAAFEGEVYEPSGRPIRHRDIDVEAYFNETDVSTRWVSRFLQFAVDPPVQNAQDRILPRLIILWLAIAVGNRRQAELIIR